jgi:hypothetical protein
VRSVLRAVAVVAALVCVPALTAFVASRVDDDGAAGSAASDFSAVSATTTAEERAAVEALLKSAVLLPEDIPEEFALDEDNGETFSTNEDVAGEQLDVPGAPTLEDLNRLGRILGYDATYSREVAQDSPLGSTLSLDVGIELYGDTKGAREAFDWMGSLFSDPELIEAWQGQAPEGTVQVSISPISFVDVGRDRNAYEIQETVYIAEIDSDVSLSAQLVFILRGSAIGSLTALAMGSPGPLQELEELTSQDLEDLARTLDERMKDALE